MSLSSPQFCDSCGAANRTHASYCKACGQPLRLPGSSTSSTLTGQLNSQYALKQRYVLLAQAGRGGFGAVYKASDTQFGNRLVAIKEMSQNGLNPQELVEATTAFKREALLLANLTHPNLPRIYEQFTDTGRSYLVMDFIDGETLEDHLNNLNGKKIPVERVLDIGIQLCSVLNYLHTQQPPIIFRDLKPANVMLTTGGHVYLIDFGIARHFKPGQTKDTAALGSSGYAAPEQYGRSQTTARADIYSLGATLHQLLSGDDPSETPFQFAPLNLAHLPALAGLDTLIMNMVSVDINKRPDSVEMVKQELQKYALQLASGQTHPLPTAYQPPKQQGARKSTKRTTRSSLPPVRPQVNTIYVCLGHSSRVTTVAWSPDGKYLATASYDKTVRIWNGADGKHVLTYKGHFARINDLAWSPDNTRIASASDDRSVQVWDVATGNTIFTYYGHNGQVGAVSWSPDGNNIASTGEDKTVQVWNAKLYTLLMTYREHNDKVLSVAWSPDGRLIASAGKDRKVQLWDPLKAQQKRSFLSTFLFSAPGQRTLKGHYGLVHKVAWSPDGKRLASTGGDRRVLVWDTLNGTITFSHGASNADMKNALAWSPTGKHLAIGGNDRSVQIWNVTNNQQTFTYYGHTGYIMSVAWSPDGTRIASTGVDRTIQVWQVV